MNNKHVTLNLTETEVQKFEEIILDVCATAQDRETYVLLQRVIAMLDNWKNVVGKPESRNNSGKDNDLGSVSLISGFRVLD